MYIKNINEIKDGMVVFMPSGIQATLFLEDENILVEYPNLYRDKYSKKDFENIIAEGLFEFHKRPPIIMESLKEADENGEDTLESFFGLNEDDFKSFSELKKEIEDNTDYIITEHGDYWMNIKSKEEDGTEIMINLNKKLSEAFNQKDNKVGAIFQALKDKKKEYLTADFKNELLTALDRIAKAYPNVKVRQQAKTFMDELGLQEYYATDKIKKFIDKHIKLLSAGLNEEDRFYPIRHAISRYMEDNQVDWEDLPELEELRKEIAERSSVKDATDEEINSAIDRMKKAENGIVEGFEDEETVEVNGEKINLNAKDTTWLDKDTFLFQLGEQKEFIDDAGDKFTIEVECWLDEGSSFHYTEIFEDDNCALEEGYISDEDKSKIEAFMARMMAEKNESLNGDIVTVIDIPLVTEKLYNKLVNLLYGNKKSKNRDYEQQGNVLNFLQKIEDRIPLGCEFHTDLEDYGFTIDEINAIKKIVRDERVDESLNEEYGPQKGNSNLEYIGGQIEDGYKEGFEPYEYGNWKLNTSEDDKWEKLTGDMKQYLLEEISYPVKDGHEYYNDLDIIIHNGSGLNKDDLLSWDIWTDEEIDEMLADDHKDLETWISYDLEFDEETENDDELEEQFKIKKKKKKEKIEDSMNETVKAEGLEFIETGNGYLQIFEKGEEFEYGNNLVGKQLFEIEHNADDEYLCILDCTKPNQTIYYIDTKDTDAYELVREIKAKNSYEELIELIKKNKGYTVDYDKFGKEEKTILENSLNESDDYIDIVVPYDLATYISNGDRTPIDFDKETYEPMFDKADEYQRMGDVEILDDTEDTDAMTDDFGFQNHVVTIRIHKNSIKENKEKEEKGMNEDCYKVYSTIDNQECGTFNSWNDVENFLNAEWGSYQVDMAKQNPEFGTEEDKNNFFGNYGVDIVQLPVAVEEPVEVPAEQPAEEIEVPAGEEVELEIQTDDGNIEIEVEPNEETCEVCGCNPCECDIDTVIEEMCNEGEQVKEDFKDGMLTDINDLDFPDALHDAVDTKEDGSLLRLSDIADMVNGLKQEIENIKQDIKNTLGELKQDIKMEVKDIQTDVNSKLDNTDSKISDLTSEEEADLEDVDYIEEEPTEETEEPTNEEPAEDEKPAEEKEEEQVEESLGEENVIFKAVEETVNSLKGEQVTLSEFFSEISNSGYGINVRNEILATAINGILDEYFPNVIVDEEPINEDFSATLKKFTREGKMSKLLKKTNEDLNQAKQEIDRIKDTGDEAKIKRAIALTTDNDQERKEATEYAIDQVSESKADSMISAMLKSQNNAKLGMVKPKQIAQ